ncbi:MAG TPA: class I SAM-dependent methyltransferase [Stellaceae bacterium]|nr:class I SAM-dependent methyltransferase [Stellaceae bacterium]
MSRLDSFIRRLEAQRACLDRAAALIGDISGPVLELGLGNGRTFDHLRTILPGRDIFVFDREIAAHPDCIPAADRLILGDMRVTLPASRGRFPASVALAHLDVGTGEEAASRALAASLAPLIAPLMRDGAIVVSEAPLDLAGWRALALPAGVAVGRYHLYRVEAAAG